MKTGRYSLAQLIGSDSIDQVVIPEIQRDYVWKEENVNTLLRSIKEKWKSKKSLSLDIAAEGQPIEDALKDNRLSTRIGFIYAYYDASDSRRLYLIDGQQRITTLYLLLLALYSQAYKMLKEDGKSAEKKNHKADFLSRYMPIDDHPKLDYRVRESAHRFLVDFIRYILDNPDGDFRNESEKYYSIYDIDPTVKSILTNFEVIKEWVKDQLTDSTKISHLIDYIENFIEFNYFDTGLSRQGERLYLYMNSRGEQLSQQEQIRPTIIAHAAGQKLAVGRDWERWQNFFWQHRDKEMPRANADAGFKGFLKVAVILHQARFLEAKMKERGEQQSPMEVRKNYIKEQGELRITKYILDNASEVEMKEKKDCVDDASSFNYEWLSKVYEAYHRLSDIYDRAKSKNGDFIGKFPFIREDKWRSSESIDTIHYIPLCGTLLLAVLWGKEISDESIYRMAMYLLCRSDNDNNSKNPDTATIQAMDMAIAMHDAGVQDVRDLSSRVEIKAQHMRDYENKMWKHIHDAEWERLYWNIVSDQEFNRFFDGTHDVLFQLTSEKVNSVTVVEMKGFMGRFKERFLKVRNGEEGRKLRKDLLKYGDISIEAGSFTDNLGNEKLMYPYKFPVDDSEWHKFFDDKDNQGKNKEKNRAIVRNYVNGQPVTSNDGILQALAKGIDIMSPFYYKYLWYKPDDALYPDIVILTRCVPKKNLALSLPSYLLQRKIKGEWFWDENIGYYVVVDFSITNGKWEVKKDVWGNFALEFVFVYEWNEKKPHWDIFLTTREEDEPLSKFFRIRDLTEWEGVWEKSKKKVRKNPYKMKLKIDFTDTKGYDKTGNLQSVKKILAWYKSMPSTLISAYKKNK